MRGTLVPYMCPPSILAKETYKEELKANPKQKVLQENLNFYKQRRICKRSYIIIKHSFSFSFSFSLLLLLLQQLFGFVLKF